jgi:hypothetical protein
MKSAVARLLVVYAVAMCINYVWEMVQMPLYQDMRLDELRSWLRCLQASFGDANITIAIFIMGLLLFRDWSWPAKLNIPKLAYITISGGGVAVLIDLFALKNGRWTYTSLMPLLPLVGVGLIPFLQLMLLPYVSYLLALRILAFPERK